MPTTSFQTCTESVSYFSEKCSQCRFACLKETPEQSPKHPDAAANRSSLSLVGAGAVIAGAAASIAGYPVFAAALTILGAIAVIEKIVRR
jgi:hypothetical protein